MKSKTIYYCTECGNETAKWQGKCSACGSWNTIVEQPKETVKKAGSGKSVNTTIKTARKLTEFDSDSEIRFTTGLSELDRVLGGGAVKGSMVLVGGAPGIGKSTLLLQICDNLCKNGTVLYITGEESERQIKLRADRLNVESDNLYILSETNCEDIIASAEELNPEIMIVDSIQTLYSEELNSAAGSVAQVKACTMDLMRYAKDNNTMIFLIGHVNKEGVIAGPKVLEHMVDCVLYFEGERSLNYRILRSAKNRFGSTNEIGVFEMHENGLCQIDNPSEMLLAERPKDAPGTCVTCVIEGSRPILAEIQALAAPTGANNPRRNSNGIDYNRAMMMIAVMEKRTAFKVNSCDTYINVIGGLNIEDPGADLATVLALASSMKDKAISQDIAAIGEIGLTGEIRSALQMEQRVKECERLGFKRCIIPKSNADKLKINTNVEIIAVSNIYEALRAALS